MIIKFFKKIKCNLKFLFLNILNFLNFLIEQVQKMHQFQKVQNYNQPQKKQIFYHNHNPLSLIPSLLLIFSESLINVDILPQLLRTFALVKNFYYC